MKKISLLFLIVVVNFMTLSCNKNNEIIPTTIVGKWKLNTITVKLDNKIYEASIDDIRKIDKGHAEDIDVVFFDFKSDSTASILFESTYKQRINDLGKYSISLDKKALIYVSNSRVDFNGSKKKYYFDIASLNAGDLNLVVLKLNENNKNSDSFFPSNGIYDSILLNYARYVMVANGVLQKEELAAKTLQMNYNLKK